MEFKFRAGDHRPPPPPPPPSPPPPPPAVYCLSKQGLPDAYLGRNSSIITLRKPFDTDQALHYERELMRLREEKLLLEIDRQRFLKEEARRELMLFEREMAIRGVTQSAGYSLPEPDHRWGTLFNAAAAPSPSPAVVVQSFHEWQKMEQLKSSDRLGFGAVALPSRVQPFMADDKKELQVPQADKRDLIVLEKPDLYVFREKRKAEKPLTSTDNVPSFGGKETPKDEWSCALCQVTVLNETTFNQHLRGKKHSRKEAGLRAQKASNVSQAAPEVLPNKRRKLLEVREETFSSAGAEKKDSRVGETTPKCEKTEGSFDLNELIPNFLKSAGKEEEDKQENQMALEQNLMPEDIFVAEKKFNFWCKKCKVGAYTKDVMFAHLNGKKHKASLQQVGQNGRGQPSKEEN